MDNNIANLIKVAITMGVCLIKCDWEKRKWVMGIFSVFVIALIAYEKYNETKRDKLIAKSILDPRELYKVIYFSKEDKRLQNHTFVKLLKNIIDTMALKYSEESLDKATQDKADKLDWFLDASVKKDDFFLERVTDKDQAIKNIKTLIRYKRSIFQLNKWSDVAYDKQNEEHEAKLMELWTNLKPDTELKDRLTEQWIDIGFQAKDPATDFRGAGVLGLHQLHHISSKQFKFVDQVKEIYADSVNQNHWYFFSCTGLNVTQKLLTGIYSDQQSKIVLQLVQLFEKIQQIHEAKQSQQKSESKTIEFQKEKADQYFMETCVLHPVFTELYFGLLKEFNQVWKSQEKHNIMEFEQVISRVYLAEFVEKKAEGIIQEWVETNAKEHKK